MQINPLFSVLTAALVSLGVSPTIAQTKAAPPAPQQSITLAVSEGVSGDNLDPMALVNKYQPIAQALSKAVGRDVIVTPVRSFDGLEQGMKKDEFDIVMARPSDYLGRGVRDYGYSLLATSKPDGQCVFVVEKSSSLKKVEDIKGKQISAPGKVAYMTHLCNAELRDRGIDTKKEQVKHAADQTSVGWTVENKMADVGFVASYTSVAKNWEKNGHRILHRTPPQPFFPIIASKRVAADDITKMQKALANMSTTEDGKKILSSLGVEGYNIESKDRLLNLLKWLEKS